MFRFPMHLHARTISRALFGCGHAARCCSSESPRLLFYLNGWCPFSARRGIHRLGFFQFPMVGVAVIRHLQKLFLESVRTRQEERPFPSPVLDNPLPKPPHSMKLVDGKNTTAPSSPPCFRTPSSRILYYFTFSSADPLGFGVRLSAPFPDRAACNQVKCWRLLLIRPHRFWGLFPTAPEL